MTTEAAFLLPIDIPEGWDCAPLDSVVDTSRGISYGIVQPGQHAADGVPIIRVNNLRNGRIDASDVLRVSPAIESKHERTRLRGGEVLLSLVGTLGECAVVPPELSGWNVARAVAVIPTTAEIDPRWVAYCLRSPGAQAAMRALATTTVQATLNLRDVRRLPLLLAPKSLRSSIVELLSALDVRIDQIRRTTATLEALAQTVFRAWFVDFGPTLAKREGAPSFPSMPARLFDLIPSELTESPLGAVPSGWDVRPLGEVASFLNGLALQKYPPRGDATDLPVIKIAELRKGSADGASSANGDVPKEYVVADGDLLFSWSGTLEATFWFGGTGALNQHLFKVTSAELPAWLCLLWLRHHLPWFRAVAASKATTMGHIKRSHLHEVYVVVPPPDVLRGADAVVGPLYDLYANLMIEARTLGDMRDYLLPELLSGRKLAELHA